MFRNLTVCGLIFMTALAFAQPVPLPNASFEDGDALPAHWSLSAGNGVWEKQGRTGGRSVSVIGTGQDSSTWKSDALPLVPGETYRITFWTRTSPDTEAGGCITAGVGGVNRDYRTGREWERKTFIFKNAGNASEGSVHLGLWNKRGRVFFDDVEVHKVIPRHPELDGLVLSADEAITGGTYKFRARLSSECSNYARPEVEHTAGFNSDRWCFGDDQQITYKFAVGNHPQADARLAFDINYYVKGECRVEAGADGKAWSALGRFNALGKHEVALPANLFPAPAIWVRLVGKGNFQIDSLSYEARLAGRPPDLTGTTWFVEPMGTVKDVDVQIESLGDVLPGRNEALCRITNKGFWGKKVIVGLKAGAEGEREPPTTVAVELPGFKTVTVRGRYELCGVGPQCVVLTVNDEKTGAPLVTASQTRTSAAIADASFGYRLPGADNLGLWWAEGTYKIGRTRPLPTEGRPISISAARNEYEPFQLVLCPKTDLRGVTFRAGDLTSGKSVIKAGSVRIETVEYVPAETATDSFGSPGDWPDPLVPYEKPLDIAANRNQPIWFTVYVPEDAPAGEYQGSIEISALGVPPTRVPLRLTVWSFTLPKETHTKTAYGVGLPANWLALKTPEDLAAAHDLYMRNCAEHRISPYDPMVFAHWKYTLSGPPENPTVTYDFTEFDKAAHRYLDELHFNAFNFGGIPGELQKHKRFTPEFNALFAKIYGPITQHLREKGWLDKAYCYWFDEPEPKDYPLVIDGMKLLKQACPGLQRLLTEQPEPELYGVVDIWTPVLGNYDPVRCHERQAAGQQVWWYVCCGPRAPYPNNFIDHPAASHRIRFWMMRKYGVTGSLYWATTYYHGAKGVLRNPWTSAMSISPEGGMWGNGDGMLLYPPVREPAKEPTVNGPYNSIRWEMLREGLEDREYFWLLEQAIAQAEKKRDAAGLTPRPDLDQLIGEAKEALDLPSSFITDLTHYSKDAQDIYAARAKIAGLIERLSEKK